MKKPVSNNEKYKGIQITKEKKYINYIFFIIFINIFSTTIIYIYTLNNILHIKYFASEETNQYLRINYQKHDTYFISSIFSSSKFISEK